MGYRALFCGSYKLHNPCFPSPYQPGEEKEKKIIGKNNISLVLSFSSAYSIFIPFKFLTNWASLVAQWLRICLPLQGTWV